MKYISIIVLVILIALLSLFFRLLWKARRNKTKQVREQYALKASSLLLTMATDLITALVGEYSVIDLAADILGIDHTRPVWLDIIGAVLACAVFSVCVWLFLRVYQNWPGDTSNRHHYMSLREESSRANINSLENALRDSKLALVALFKEDPQLKPYVASPETYAMDLYSGNQRGWHEEFSKLYMLLTRRTKIDIEHDWHPQEHCLIFQDMDNHQIAVLCSTDYPDQAKLDRYLKYIHKQHRSYYKRIVAIKNGRGTRQNINVSGYPIQLIYKENALDELVDFSEYYDSLQKERNAPLMGSPYKIDDVYVKPYCREESSGKKFLLHQYVATWLSEPGQRQLALLGDFGQGKTVFSNQLAYSMVQNGHPRIPILIRLRNKSPRNATPSEIIAYFSNSYGIDPESLLLLNANGRLLLIFDGFDEMDLVGTDSIRRLHFQHLWDLAVPGSKILITGRPNYFPTQEEMRSALGLRAGAMPVPKCDALFLELFDEEQILGALRSCPPAVTEGIRSALNQSSTGSFVDLIRRPSLLFYLSLIWEDHKMAERYGNLTSALILNEFLQSCFARQESKSQRNPYHFLSPAEREYFLTGIAAKMYKQNISTITNEEFQSAIAELISIFPDKLSAENPVVLNLRNGNSVKAFAYEDQHSMSAIENDVRSCGVLVSDFVNYGLTFAHKSFHELLLAKLFLGREVQKHDATTTISLALSTLPDYSPRLKNDYAIRKLLAELTVNRLNLSISAVSDQEKSQKIFQKCAQALRYRIFRKKPEDLFRKCLKQKFQYAVPSTEDVQIGRRRFFRRFVALTLLLFLLFFVFFIRTTSITVALRTEALQFYENMSSIIEPVTPTVSGPWLLLVCIGIALLTIPFITRTHTAKVELVLLTWYYACLENGVSRSEIFRSFTTHNAALFENYLMGASLTKLQAQFSRTQKQKYPKTHFARTNHTSSK